MSAAVTRREILLVGVARLLKEHGMSALATEISKKLNGRPVDLKLDKNTLVISGTKDDVHTAHDYVRKTFLKQVSYETVEISESDLKADIFTLPSLKCSLVEELEKDHHCVIEVRTTDSTKSLSDVLKANNAQAASSNITVSEGSLTEFQADVLVNTIVTNTTDLAKAGMLSKAFLAAGGSELGQEFAAVGTPIDFGRDVAVTKACGTVFAKKIYHAAMRNYRNAQSVQLLYDLISTCLSMAKADNMTSIAFPTLGCGNFGFDARDVVDCFKRASSAVGGLEIYVVAFEHSVFEVFKERCSRKETKVVFHINAMSHDVVKKVREEIKCRAMNLVISASIDHDLVDQLSAQVLSDIAKLQSSDVHVEIDKPNKRITVKAQSHHVEPTRAKIAALLVREEKRVNDPQHIKQTRGADAYLEALSKQPITYPPYWALNEQPKSSSWGGGKCDRVQLAATTAIYKEVEKLLIDTWESSLVGLGNDAAGLSHSSINLKKIWRIENPSLYYKYCQKRKEICLSGSHLRFVPIKGLSGEAEVKTRTLNLAMLESSLVPEINEYLLLHCTRKDTVDIIAKQGLDSRLAASSYFGGGVYCAESSTKSDQYADLARSRVGTGQPLYMYVVRVILGNPYVARAPKAYKRPPCTQSGCNSDLCTSHPVIHDSVLGTHRPDGTRLLFREFIVYHPEQSYPEYLVEYVRQ